MSDESVDQYPRPQLRRRDWTDLCGPWGFAHDDADIGLSQRWFDRAEPFNRQIIVPFPPESRASGIHAPDFHPTVWYRRQVMVEPAPRTLLHFGAVDYHAMVWVNGRFAGEHRGGHTSFALDITQFLDGPDAIITVRAHDDPRDMRQPRGKQDWRPQPHEIWYHRTTGIWQPVWLEPLPARSIAEIRWVPDVDDMSVGLTVRLDGPPVEGSRLRVTLAGDMPRRVLVDDTCLLTVKELRRDLKLNVDEQQLRRRQLTWTPFRPRLIDATLELLGPDGTIIDRVESYFGLRTVTCQDGRFILNGIPTFMRLVLAQNYWPETHLAAPSSEALKREVELAKALGFNGVRIHQKIEDPRFLYWCDKLGMMVWGEAANAYVYDDLAAERLQTEWLEAVRRDFNHPCIVAWVPLNESWGVPQLDRSPQQRHFVQALYHMTRSVDPTRPVIGNDGWTHAVGDLFGVHDYSADGAVLTERYGTREAVLRTFTEVRPNHHPILASGHEWRDEPIVISEYGGLSFVPGKGSNWFGYGKFTSEAALLEKYAELTHALLDSTVLAGFCYTQLTDTEQETNGLLDAQRNPKVDMAAIRAINSRPSKAVPIEILEAVLKEDIERRRAEAADPHTVD